MSISQRVVILNKPLKIYNYTIIQWIVLAGTLVLALLVGFHMPGNIKVANLPLGFWLGLTIFCLGIVFVHAVQMKPFAWWRNQIFYHLDIYPKLVLPHVENGNIYPDATIVEISTTDNGNYVISNE